MIKLVSTEYPTSSHFKDRSGQNINGIEILEFLGYDKSYNSVYRCKCHCGNIWETRINGIISGTTTGCGCMTKRTDRAIDKWEAHIGEVHNKLKIIGFERILSGERYRPHYICECECGNTKSIRAQQVLDGKTVSCGCKQKEVLKEKLIGGGRHNQHYKTRLYSIYTGMRNRCYNENSDRYYKYGAKGIYICDEWLDYENGFNRFYDWSMKNGYKDDLTIDRIDNNGPYAPWNCRWVPMKVQANNKSTNRYVTYEQRFDEIGKPPIRWTFTISQWSEITGLHKNLIRERLIRYNMPVSVALTKIPSKNIYDNKFSPIIIPKEYMQYNRPDKYSESIHD